MADQFPGAGAAEGSVEIDLYGMCTVCPRLLLPDARTVTIHMRRLVLTM